MPGQDTRRSSKRKTAAEGRVGDSAATGPTGPLAASEKLEARISDLVAERDRLRAELSAALAKVAELESARDEVLDRIAWVIDSLHSMTEE